MPELVLDYDYHTGDPELDATALEVRRLRRQADDLAAAAKDSGWDARVLSPSTVMACKSSCFACLLLTSAGS